MINERLIIITAEDIMKDEPALWRELLEMPIYRLHIRKPKASKEELSALIEAVPVALRKKLVLHHHADIATKFELGGVHVSYGEYGGNINIPVSCSVHTWQEAQQVTNKYSYYFMSPVFNSISKKGYNQNTGLQYMPSGLQNQKVYALGGITPGNIGMTLSYGYCGVVALGYVWDEPEHIMEKVKELLNATVRQPSEI